MTDRQFIALPIAGIGAANHCRIMSVDKFLTPEEVSKRYRDAVTVGTLENWRALGIGPSYIKVGKAVLYPVEELNAWDRQNTVVCRNSKVVGRSRITDD